MNKILIEKCWRKDHGKKINQSLRLYQATNQALAWKMANLCFHRLTQPGDMEHISGEELGIGTLFDRDACLYQWYFRFSSFLRDHHYMHMALTIKVQSTKEILIASCFKQKQSQRQPLLLTRKFGYGLSICVRYNWGQSIKNSITQTINLSKKWYSLLGYHMLNLMFFSYQTQV